MSTITSTLQKGRSDSDRMRAGMDSIRTGVDSIRTGMDSIRARMDSRSGHLSEKVLEVALMPDMPDRVELRRRSPAC